jgi:acyl-CoA thioester hydrolase
MTMEIGQSHEVLLPLRWGDSDSLNHLNNTVYFRLMEEARMQMLYAAGVRLPSDHGPILAHVSCDFRRAFTYPATARVIHTLTRLGSSSMDHDLVLEHADEPGVPYATGRSVLVWMDYAANKPAPWPEAVLQALGNVMRSNRNPS